MILWGFVTIVLLWQRYVGQWPLSEVYLRHTTFWEDGCTPAFRWLVVIILITFLSTRIDNDPDRISGSEINYRNVVYMKYTRDNGHCRMLFEGIRQRLLFAFGTASAVLRPYRWNPFCSYPLFAFVFSSTSDIRHFVESQVRNLSTSSSLPPLANLTEVIKSFQFHFIITVWRQTKSCWVITRVYVEGVSDVSYAVS